MWGKKEVKDDAKIFAWAIEGMDLLFVILQKNERSGLRENIMSSVFGMLNLTYLSNIQVEILNKS